MKKNRFGRRAFIKQCLTGSVAVAGLSCKNLFVGKKGKVYDPQGLPTRVLGKTGVRIPLIVVGCGSRFCTVQEPEKSVEILNYALNHGFYYWDTAHDYVYNNVVSEERLGLVLKDRREEVFLSTKVGEIWRTWKTSALKTACSKPSASSRTKKRPVSSDSQGTYPQRR